jgi:hypothetical protein
VLKTLTETIHMVTSITNFIPVKYLYASHTTPPSGATSTSAAASMPESMSAFDFAMNYLANNTDTPSSHPPTADTTTQFIASTPPATSAVSPSPAAKCSHLVFDEDLSKYQVSAPSTSLQQATYAQCAAAIPPPATVTLQPTNDTNPTNASSSSYQLSSDGTEDSPLTDESSPELVPPWTIIQQSRL